MISLDDKYTQTGGSVLVTASQALVRLLIEQLRRDRAAGHRTAGFVSGYRGSPLGGFDMELWRAKAHLGDEIRFQPGTNEDLAVTSVWGSQQVPVFPGARYEGVFGLWYGKGPGVDRSGDALKHANSYGTSALGGVLAIAGDDHGAKSSSLAHQSEFALLDAMIPVLHPADLTDILTFGLYGYALSRYSGLWVGMKITAALAESSGTAFLPTTESLLLAPRDFIPPADGLHIRWPDEPLDQERRLVLHKLPAARAFVRANPLDRRFGVTASGGARFGIVSAGKSWRDVRAALALLGLEERELASRGILLVKIGVVWPLDADLARTLYRGLEEILVVEEKRSLLEAQLRECLYDLPAHTRPRIFGKVGPNGEPLLPAIGEHSVDLVARAIAERLRACLPSIDLASRLAAISDHASARKPLVIDGDSSRSPYFCSGCPHNSSTRLPDASIAFGGIGCHSMAMFMERRTVAYTHMGGEGATWIGQAPFTCAPHAFQNLGDGTFFHSGSLGVRAAVAAGVNLTFKILYNDAVAMTGGQPVEGTLSVAAMTRLLHAEGVSRIDIVAEDTTRYRAHDSLAPGTRVHARQELDAVQRQLRDTPGTSVLIYDQVCAAEKRRRRKRGTLPPAGRRVFINEAVCEGCGDCGVQSNCLSIVPSRSDFGRKRRIDQSSCNADYSCLQGFCPSFVTVRGTLRAATGSIGTQPTVPLPDAPLRTRWRTFTLLGAGIGGTGVVTVGAVCAAAAHIEGLACAVYDMTGMAQKGGAVFTHVTLARCQGDLLTTQIPSAAADVLLGFDLLAAAGPDALSRLKPAGIAIVNTHESMSGRFTRQPDLEFPAAALRARFEERARRCEWIDATSMAERLFGEPLAANLILLGYVFQRGELPLAAQSIESAIRLNGGNVERNLAAFAEGRRLVLESGADETECIADTGALEPENPAVAELVDRYASFLESYQSAAYANRYREIVMRAQAAESRIAPGNELFAAAVARSLARLMAYKDEYEVARLHTQPAFLRSLAERFVGPIRITFHFAPPFLPHKGTGRPVKREIGAWIIPVLKLLAIARRLRGTPLDLFALTADRRFERRLLADYEHLLEKLCDELTPSNHAVAVQLAALPMKVRGYGIVKREQWIAACVLECELLQRFDAAVTRVPAAEVTSS